MIRHGFESRTQYKLLIRNDNKLAVMREEGPSTLMMFGSHLVIIGVIAQLAERYPCTVEDVGSNPIGSTKGLFVQRLGYYPVTVGMRVRFSHRPLINCVKV